MFSKWKQITAIIVLTVMIVTTAIPTSANMGNYLNNLMTQMKGLAPKAYEGQSRGYFVGGSASVRWGFQEEPLISFTPPSLKVGCSGIDIVMGGFSYLNFEYLVQKLQAILAAAPAFAFKVALKTLCEACDNVLTALENIANMINQLNVDSCQAAQAVGTWAGLQFAQAVGNTSSGGTSESWFSALSKDIKNVTGSWKNFIKDYAGVYDCIQYAPNSQAAKECKAKVGHVSFITPLLSQAFSKINTDRFPFEGVMRAAIGDIYQDKNENNKENIPSVKIDPGCYENAQDNYNIVAGMVTGVYKVKNTTSTTNAGCQDVNDPQQGLEHKVEQALKSIRNKIKSGGGIDQNEINLINASRAPIYRLMSLAVLVERLGGDTQDTLTDNFISHFKKGIAYDIAVAGINAVGQVTKRLVAAAAGEKQGGLNQTTILKMEKMIDAIDREIELATSTRRDIWAAIQHQLGDLMTRETKMKEFIFQELAKNKLLDSYIFAKGLR